MPQHTPSHTHSEAMVGIFWCLKTKSGRKHFVRNHGIGIGSHKVEI